MSVNLRELLIKVSGTGLKLGICAIAPQASSKIFTSPNGGVYSDVVKEMTGVSSPKMAAFVGCAVNVLAKDFVDITEWVIKNNVIDKAVDYFVQPNQDKINSDVHESVKYNDTFIDQSQLCPHYHDIALAQANFVDHN